jgi:corrinoid protein of di/trimethylamine methyltransferase
MHIDELLTAQRRAILDGDTPRAVELAQAAIGRGADLRRCIEEGYASGIREVGRLWEEGEYFLPELVQGADAMKAAMQALRPALLKDAQTTMSSARVVIGTIQGDIHDIGKTLVATVLEANGLSVIDLGSDVPVSDFVDRAEAEQARVIGLSALLTTTMSGQQRVIELLEERGLRDRVFVLVGGAPVTRSYAKEIGADAYAANAMDALRETRRLLDLAP